MIENQSLAHNALVKRGLSLVLMEYQKLHQYCYRGRVTIPQIPQGFLNVVFGFNSAPFFEAPCVYITERPIPLDGFWPNIEVAQHGLHKLCVFDDTTHTLEPYAIEAVIETYLNRVKEVVTRNTEDRVESFKSEVSAYFRSDNSGFYAKKNNDSIFSLQLYKKKKAEQLPYFFAKSSNGTLEHITKDELNYIPTIVIEIGDIKAMPSSHRGLEQLKDMIEVVRKSERSKIALIRQKLNTFIQTKKDEINESGCFALGFHFQGNLYSYIFYFTKVQLKQKLTRVMKFIDQLIRGQLVKVSQSKSGDFLNVSRVHLKDGSPSALIERNYSNNFIGKRICIIGVGTLGSYLAHTLVKHGAGISQPLYIYDQDTLYPQNLSRHFLGSDSLFKNKAVAMAEYLSKANPDRIIKAHNIRFERLNEISKSMDIVIDATGDFTEAVRLNHEFKTNEYDFKLYHGYLCAGGHSARLFKHGIGGCYRCLFDDQHRHYDKEFKKTNQKIIINRNCGESNVQFSVDSSMGAVSFMATNILEQERTPSNKAFLYFKSVGKQAAEHTDRKVIKSTSCPACQDIKRQVTL